MRDSFAMLRLRLLAFTSAGSIVLRREPEGFPPVLWPVDQQTGEQIARRQFTFASANATITQEEGIPQEMPVAWYRGFYSFSFMRNLLGGRQDRAATSLAREMVHHFLTQPLPKESVAWEYGVCGQRLLMWIESLDTLLRGSSKLFRRRLGRSIVKHIQKLRYLPPQLPASERIDAICGLLAASAKLYELDSFLDESYDMLRATLPMLTHPDGAHKSGMPEAQLHTLCQLISMREMLLDDDALYVELVRLIKHMGAGLRFFCHGDGRLALFQGGRMGQQALITRALELSGTPEQPPLSLLCGYHRLQRRSTVVILRDYVGSMHHQPSSYQDAMALEVSDDAERIIVNCGGYTGEHAHWHAALRQNAAHSALCIEYLPPKGSPISSHMPTVDEGLAGEQFNHVFVNGISQLYSAHGITHKRYIKLMSRGDRLSGSDSILLAPQTPFTPDSPPPLAVIRFHLHPDIRCQKLQDGHYSLATTGGKQWIFSVDDGESTHVMWRASIEESVYLGYYGKPQKTQQMVVRFPLESPHSELHWIFAKQR